MVVLASQLAPRTLSLFSLGTRIIERLSLCEQVQGICTKACMLEWQALFPLQTMPLTNPEEKDNIHSCDCEWTMHERACARAHTHTYTHAHTSACIPTHDYMKLSSLPLLCREPGKSETLGGLHHLSQSGSCWRDHMKSPRLPHHPKYALLKATLKWHHRTFSL